MPNTTLPGLLKTGDHASRPDSADPDPGLRPAGGMLYSCTDHSLVYQYDIGANSWTTWATLGGGGIPLTLIDAAGDLIVGSAADTAARVAIGTSGYVLTSNGTTAAWAAAAVGRASPDDVPASPSAEDDEFEAGSLDAKWTHTGSGGLTFAYGRMTIAHAASSTDEKFLQPYVPGAGVAFTIAAKFSGVTLIGGTDYIGLEVGDAGGGAIAGCDLRATSAGQLSVNKDNPGGGSTANVAPMFGTAIYMRISRDTSNVYTFEWSQDGIAWSTYGLATGTSSTAVTKIGFRFGQTASAAYKRASVEWFRRS